MSEIFIEEQNSVSGRYAVLEENGSSAWLYLTPLRLSMEGRSSGTIDDKAEDKMEDETYRYYIPFKLDGQDYAVDIAFRLDYHSDRRIGIPGVP